MTSAVELLATYKSVHLNKKNIKTHFVGIPLIIFALMIGLHFFVIESSALPFTLSLATIIFALVCVYYFMLNSALAIGMTISFSLMLYGAWLVANMPNAGIIAIATFVIGWVFQFVGHHYEKAKPAFLTDLKQLFIGPLFLMAEFYFMLGLTKQLEQQITPLAIEKRKQFNQQ